MARPIKEGMDYFPFNVDFFEDDKLELIEAEFGEKGLLITIKLICKIYKENGYYYQWGADQCLLFSKKAGMAIAPNLVTEVVNGLIRRSFFDKRVFDKFSILTSSGIQKRYFEATKNRKLVTVFKELLVYTDINSINSGINLVNMLGNTQSKVKESKAKESKVISPSDKSEEPKKKDLVFWKEFIEHWNVWYLGKFPDPYHFLAQDFAHLKKIYKFLENRAVNKNKVFTKEILLESFQFFLEKAWHKDDWLRTHFSIANILSQFNSIVNGKNFKNNGAFAGNENGTLGKKSGGFGLLSSAIQQTTYGNTGNS